MEVEVKLSERDRKRKMDEHLGDRDHAKLINQEIVCYGFK